MEKWREVHIYRHVGIGTLISAIFLDLFVIPLMIIAFFGLKTGTLLGGCLALFFLAFAAFLSYISYRAILVWIEKKKFNRQPILATVDDEGILFPGKPKILWSNIAKIEICHHPHVVMRGVPYGDYAIFFRQTDKKWYKTDPHLCLAALKQKRDETLALLSTFYHGPITRKRWFKTERFVPLDEKTGRWERVL